jgi:hypothetical protein
MTKLPRIGMILGSLQANGITRKVAHAVQHLVGDRLALGIVEIGDLPLYNPERDSEGVAEWETFRQAVAPLDGILFLTPEYNRSIPAALKNAIDVGSRPYGLAGSVPIIICASAWCFSTCPRCSNPKCISAMRRRCSTTPGRWLRGRARMSSRDSRTPSWPGCIATARRQTEGF